MSSSSTDSYHFIPYRFFLNQSTEEIDKLERLTNLFPDMKGIIELELFKIKNLTRTITRLSTIYKPLTRVDTYDDTINLCLGPYQVSLGPAIYGAYHFKSISKALLASSNSKPKPELIHQYSNKRRHDAVIRRFRRAVRKLIHIKSIIDQLRLSSILIPYNQYELHTKGIYDLALAGHIVGSHNEGNYTNKLTEKFNNVKDSEYDNPFYSSRFFKINTLLQLLSTNSDLNQADSKTSDNLMVKGLTESTINSKQTQTSINSISQDLPENTHSLSPVVISTKRNSLIYPKRNSVINQLKSTNNDNSDFDSLSLSDSIVPQNSSTTISPSLSNNSEDNVIKHVSSLITNFLLSRQSTTTSSDPVECSSSFDLSNQSLTSSIADQSHMNHLLNRIQYSVNDRLSLKENNTNQNISSNLTKPSKIYRRQKFLRTSSLRSPNESIEELDGNDSLASRL